MSKMPNSMIGKTNKVFIEKVLDQDIPIRIQEGEILALKGFLWRVVKIKPKDITLRRLSANQVEKVRKQTKEYVDKVKEEQLRLEKEVKEKMEESENETEK